MLPSTDRTTIVGVYDAVWQADRTANVVGRNTKLMCVYIP